MRQLHVPLSLLARVEAGTFVLNLSEENLVDLSEGGHFTQFTRVKGQVEVIAQKCFESLVKLHFGSGKSVSINHVSARRVCLGGDHAFY